jgi:hypothetical protein
MRSIDVPSTASFHSLSTVYRIRISIYIRMRCGRYRQRKECSTAAVSATTRAFLVNNNKQSFETSGLSIRFQNIYQPALKQGIIF